MSVARQIQPRGEGTTEPISTGEYRSIELQAIRLDQSAQPRESLNTERTAEYAEAMKAGDKFPSLVVFFDGETYWLADGFHRHYAAQQASIKALSCRVLPGGLREAILWSVGANAKHGLARSDTDKERAVLRLLTDDEWSAWSDREIAKRCHVSHAFVGAVKKRNGLVTGHASTERTYVTKHGTTATMKTAGINAGRNQFQAKASEDNGSITGGAGAAAGEASRLASGRTDAGEAASVGLPAISDAERDADAIEAVYDRAGDEGRALFLARKHLRQESNPATATGGEDVNRSAERASSAVEVGAPVSPEGAAVSASSGRPEGRKRLQVAREPINAAEPDVLAATREGLSMERGIDQCVTAGETALNSPSTAPTVEPEATPSPPPASGNPINPDPHTPGRATAAPANQVSQPPAQNDGAPLTVGQGGHGPVDHCGHAKQEPAVEPQGRNKPVSGEAASVTQFLNPNCQKPETCKWARSQASCAACANAAAKARAA